MILRTASDPLKLTTRIIFTSAARVAWRLILARLKHTGTNSILIPAYIGFSEREGSGISDPINATCTPYTFYSLDSNLRPDLDDLAARLKTGQHPLLLVVHYFGIVHVDLLKVRRLCERYNTLLIEDCAHVPWPLYNTTGVGSVGDAAFYSMHKSIAVPSGGMLRINNPDIDYALPTGTDRCDESSLEQFIRTDMAAVAAKRCENYRWLAKRLSNVGGLGVLYPKGR